MTSAIWQPSGPSVWLATGSGVIVVYENECRMDNLAAITATVLANFGDDGVVASGNEKFFIINASTHDIIRWEWITQVRFATGPESVFLLPLSFCFSGVRAKGGSSMDRQQPWLSTDVGTSGMPPLIA